MSGYHDKIEELTDNNTNFRKVLFTGKYTQLVVMSLKPGEDIGMEVHDNLDQFFRIEEGFGKAVIDGVEYDLVEGDALIVPGGSRHNLTNTSGEKDLKLYTMYSPPNHPEGTVHKTKEEARKAEDHEH